MRCDSQSLQSHRCSVEIVYVIDTEPRLHESAPRRVHEVQLLATFQRRESVARAGRQPEVEVERRCLLEVGYTECDPP
jgi:hypothetical protein